MKIKHTFVEYIPDQVEEHTLYISIKFGTAVHKCMCGCGNEVVTPLSPTDWELIYNGETVSLYPSIGNWGFTCESHYWITRSRVIFAERWSSKKVMAIRLRDKNIKSKYFKNSSGNNSSDEKPDNR